MCMPKTQLYALNVEHSQPSNWPTVTLGGKETMEQPETIEAEKRASGSLERIVRRWWYGLRPDKFPRQTVFNVWWFIKCRTDINFMYFRMHGHWPVNRLGCVVSLRQSGVYDPTPNSD